MKNLTPAIFLDRDGTINVDNGYVFEIGQFKFIDGVIDACLKLQQMQYALVIITNQSGIARGIFSEQQFVQLTQWMDWSFVNRGIELDGIYFCPHHPDVGTEQYRQICNCRKPMPGMLFSAKKDLHIDMAASYIVGDKVDDLKAGMAAGVGTKVLVKTGQTVTTEGESLADWVIDSLVDLPKKIKRLKNNLVV